MPQHFTIFFVIIIPYSPFCLHELRYMLKGKNLGHKFIIAILWKWGIRQADYKICVGKSCAIRNGIKVRVGNRHIIVPLSVVEKTYFSFGFIIYVGCLTYCEGRNPNQCKRITNVIDFLAINKRT